MTFAPAHPEKRVGVQMAQPVEGIDPNRNRDDAYDEMLLDFHSYVTGEKQNPFSYEHDYTVQEVLMDAVGGATCRETKGETR